MKKQFLLFLSVFAIIASLNAQTFYTSTTSGFVLVDDFSAWEAEFVLGTAPTVLYAPAFQPGETVWVIEAGDQIAVGGPGNNTVTLPDNHRIVVFGSLGFAIGNNNIVLGENGRIDLEGEGVFGFALGGGTENYQGNPSSSLFIDGVEYTGPIAAESPDFANIASRFSSSAVWIGADDNDWLNTANWRDGIVPNGLYTIPPPVNQQSYRNAIIPDSILVGGVLVELTTFPILTSSEDIEVKRLITFDSASIEIGSGASITIDACLANFGEITVRSGGALVQTENSPLVCFDGNFIVEVDLPGVNPWFIGSPVSTSHPHSVSIPNGGLSGPFVDNGDCADSDLNLDWVGMMQLEEAAAIPDGDCSSNLWAYTSSNMQAGRGYAAYAPAGHTLVFEGIINNNGISYGGLGRQTGTVTLPNGASESRGWHLVSNPYPSPMTISGTQLNAMGFDAQVHRWNQGTWVSDFPGADVTIAVGQGFQVRTSTVGGTASLDLDNTFRTTDAATFYKSLEGIGSNLKMTLSNDSYSDDTYIYFREDATDGFDYKYDANRLFGLGHIPLLYSLSSDNQRLSFNAIQNLEADVQKEVNLGFYEGAGGNFELSFANLSTLETELLEVSVILEDKKLDEFIQVSENTTYAFTFDEGDERNRFVVHFFPTEKSIEEEEEILSIEDVSKNQILLFPNPTNGGVSVLLDENHAFNNLKVTNVTGKTVVEMTLTNSQKTVHLNLGNLSDGLYFVTLNGNSSQVVKKIIKN